MPNKLSVRCIVVASCTCPNLILGMYNGFDWYGRTLEVREDRYAGLTGPGSYRGNIRGGSRGGLRGSGLRGGGFRGGFRGGYVASGAPGAGAGAGAGAGGRDFSSQDLYADYSGPDQSGNLRLGGGGGFGDAAYGGAGYGAFEADPSQQIMVRNVGVHDDERSSGDEQGADGDA